MPRGAISITGRGSIAPSRACQPHCAGARSARPKWSAPCLRRMGQKLPRVSSARCSGAPTGKAGWSSARRSGPAIWPGETLPQPAWPAILISPRGTGMPSPAAPGSMHSTTGLANWPRPDTCTTGHGCRSPRSGSSRWACRGNWAPPISSTSCAMVIRPPTRCPGAGWQGCIRRARPTSPMARASPR